MNIDFPFKFDARGHTAAADDERHIRNMIGQVLFISPGERVNRPDFGSGVMQLVFAPNSDELAAATQVLVQGALQQWLSDLIRVDSVNIDNEEETLRVTVEYTIRRTNSNHVAEFTQGGA